MKIKISYLFYIVDFTIIYRFSGKAWSINENFSGQKIFSCFGLSSFMRLYCDACRSFI